MPDVDGVRITSGDIQRLINKEQLGDLEYRLLEICAAVKEDEKGRTVYARVIFPKEGGVLIDCRRGWLGNVLWAMTRPVRMFWEK